MRCTNNNATTYLASYHFEMNLEDHIEDTIRKLTVVYHDTTALLNRSKIKRWLNELEKSVSKENPDFVVLKGCCRYILFEIHRKEWCKYFFLSVNYAPNQPITRSHIVLSRYPLLKNDTFGTPPTHVARLQIPFNDVPMRYEYEDLDVQQIDIQNIVLFITDDVHQEDPLYAQHAQTVQSSLQSVCNTTVQNPPTIILFGLNSDSPLQPQNWELCDANLEADIKTGVSYLSQGWKFSEYTSRTNALHFEMIHFD